MWNHRNSVLFAKGKVDELSGISAVRKAIRLEQQLGLGQLDPAFSPYLKLPASSFSKMKSIDLRCWLSLIRQAREETGYQYADELVTSIALREWVGLSKSPSQPHRNVNSPRRIRFDRLGYCD